MRKPILFALLAPIIICLGGAVLYNLPPIHDRLAWRVEAARAKVKYALAPPEQVVFVPQDAGGTIAPGQIATAVAATLSAMTPTPTPTPNEMTTPGIETTPLPSATPTLIPTPIPVSIRLTGVVHEYQKWNNCGPATLAMALTYWGWKGDQRDTAPVLKPNPRDKNVMPYEMKAYVDEHTGLRAIVRVAGNLDLLKQLIAAGFPVVVEKGFEVSGEGWMGHYEVLTGYEDDKQRFIAQDSYIMENLPVPYAELENFWQDFNYIYLVIYPPEREAEVMAMLGADADETANFQLAVERASNETAALQGREQYFAWYNRGSSLVNLGDFAGAAAAYDQAFRMYPDIPENERPWRILWYETGAYFAYFYAGRYNDVINLATTTLSRLSDEPVLEESYVWRARAKAALGDTQGAIEDLRKSLEMHAGFPPAVQELAALGATP